MRDKHHASESANKPKKQWRVKYSHLMIGIMIMFMMIFIIDRFTTNLWPLYFTKASPIEHDITATSFFVICWIMGRELIVASSLIWLLQCRCFWNFIFEHKPNWLIVDDIMIENNHLHYNLGWFGIGVPMIVHTWLVFIPLLQKHELHIYLTWWRPIDGATGFYLENCHQNEVNISINDIYALLISTVIFLILFPLAMHKKFRSKHWSLSQYIHIIASTLYGIELLRTPFTAHCWFISTPFIICYIIDRFLGIFYYRMSKNGKIMCQYNVDDKYILLFMHIPDIYIDHHNKRGTYREIGDCFWINTKKYGYYKFQASHPFTTFYNHQYLISNKRINKSCRRIPLGNAKHKFSVKTRRFQRSVSNTKLNADESYELHRNDTESDLDTMTTMTIQQLSSIDAASDIQPIAGLQISSNAPPHKLYKSSFWSRTFKTFTNKKNNKQSNTENSDGKNRKNSWDKNGYDKISFDNNWNVGFLMAVHERNDKFGFTQHIKQTNGIHEDMLCYGPYRSSFANIINEMEEDITANNDGAIVLIATGAGAAYIIDFMLYLRAKIKNFEEDQDREYILRREIRIHFSCRSVKLFQWITDFLCEESIENIHICAHLTSHKNVYDYHESQNLNKVRKAKIGRAAFDVFLKQSPKNSKVFFCGSPFIQNKLKILCQKFGFLFFEGHSFH